MIRTFLNALGNPCKTIVLIWIAMFVSVILLLSCLETLRFFFGGTQHGLLIFSQVVFASIAILCFILRSIHVSQGGTRSSAIRGATVNGVASSSETSSEHLWHSSWTIAWCLALGALCVSEVSDGWWGRIGQITSWLVVLAWGSDAISGSLFSFRNISWRWRRESQGLLVTVVFVMCMFWSLPSGSGWGWMAGMSMLVSSLIAFFIRLVVLPFDHSSVTGIVFLKGFRLINRWWVWHDLPTAFAVLNLAALREELRLFNLHDTSHIPVSCPSQTLPDTREIPNRVSYERSLDGRFNDVDMPDMGRGSESPPGNLDGTQFERSHPCARFGRNVPLEMARCDESMLLSPNPRDISNLLLACPRGETRKSATSVNLLVAAWIQFEVHDWFSHGEPVVQNPIEVPIKESDHWQRANADGASGQCPMMHVRRTRPDPTRDYEAEKRSGKAPLKTFVNSESHWWDASQVYGNERSSQRLREVVNGEVTSRLIVETSKGGLAVDPFSNGAALTGFRENWWVGLTLMHTLFCKEHNAICAALEREYPAWDADTVYGKARLITAALIAKIHTVEWTPAILQNPALEIAMPANWWGLFSKRVIDTMGRWGLNEAFWGIPQSGVGHNNVPFGLTEEFAAVYRLHPLMPDELVVRSSHDGSVQETFRLPVGVIGTQSELMDKSLRHSQSDLMYSFGVSHPGSLELFNYPEFLRRLERADGQTLDLASIDILRDRERGVPRYNAMREALRLPPIESFDCFDHAHRADGSTTHVSRALREVYGVDKENRDRVNDLDLMVGMLAEKKPPGFAISDTAFRIFILMASRRLKSDRFIAEDFRPEIYTQLGIDWVNNNTMVAILLRHYPELASALYGVSNAFKPWRTVDRVV